MHPCLPLATPSRSSTASRSRSPGPSAPASPFTPACPPRSWLRGAALLPASRSQVPQLGSGQCLHVLVISKVPRLPGFRSVVTLRYNSCRRRGKGSMKRATAKLLSGLAQERRLKPSLEIIGRLETEHGFQWQAVGGRENNYGSINIGSDPGYALIERVTNSIDAVIEREAIRQLRKAKKKSSPSSPNADQIALSPRRESGIPVGGARTIRSRSGGSCCGDRGNQRASVR
jgi:hypothetical protein